MRELAPAEALMYRSAPGIATINIEVRRYQEYPLNATDITAVTQPNALFMVLPGIGVYPASSQMKPLLVFVVN